MWRQRLVAVAAVAVLAGVNLRGITRTAALARVLVTASILALVVVVVAIATGGHAHPGNLGGLASLRSGGAYGVLQSAGLLFFAFAGYARIATLGEEVRDPARTIPRAIPIALAITVALYLAVAVATLLAAGPERLAGATAPITVAVHAGARSPGRRRSCARERSSRASGRSSH